MCFYNLEDVGSSQLKNGLFTKELETLFSKQVSQLQVYAELAGVDHKKKFANINNHWVKSARMQVFADPYFPV